MSELKKSIAQKLQEKGQVAREAAMRGAEALGQGVQKGGEVVAHGAQAVGEGAQKGGRAVAHAAGEGAQLGGQAVAQGAKIVGEGVQKGAQVVKEHPKETAIIAGAAVVAAGALPFTPFGVPAAAAFVAAAAKGAKTVQDGVQIPDPSQACAEEGPAPAATGLIAALTTGATAAETVLDKREAGKASKKK